MPIPYKVNLEKFPHAVVISLGDVIRKDFVVEDMQFVGCKDEAAMRRAFKAEVARAEESVEGQEDILISVGELSSTKPIKVGRVEVRGNATFEPIFDLVKKMMSEQADLWTVDKFDEVPQYPDRMGAGTPAKGTAKTRKSATPKAAPKRASAASKVVKQVTEEDAPSPRRRGPAKRASAILAEDAPSPRSAGVRKRLRATNPKLGFIGMTELFGH